MRCGLKVVAYDIADYKRLCRIANLMLNYGKRIQKSVFESYLNDIQTIALIKSINSIIEPVKDRVILYHVCMKDSMKVIIAGKQIRHKDYDYFIH